MINNFLLRISFPVNTDAKISDPYVFLKIIIDVRCWVRTFRQIVYPTSFKTAII